MRIIPAIFALALGATPAAAQQRPIRRAPTPPSRPRSRPRRPTGRRG